MLKRNLLKLGNVLDCKTVSDRILEITRKSLESFNCTPRIHILLSEDSNGKSRLDSLVYVKKKIYLLSKLGIDVQVQLVNERMSKDQVMEIVDSLNRNPNNHGTFLQMPLASDFFQFDAREIIDMIDVKKDIDGLNKSSFANLLLPPLDASYRQPIRPTTPLGICALLKYYNIDVTGQQIAIVGKGNLVGKPLSIMLMNEPFNATVVVCDIHTQNIESIVHKSKVLIAACGKAGVIKPNYVNSETVVIDVGINKAPNGKTSKSVVGDVCHSTYDYCKYYTSVPGGVGLLTVASLSYNVLNAYCLQKDIKSADLLEQIDEISFEKKLKKITDQSTIDKNSYKIQLVSSAYNGSTQIIHKELERLGHQVQVHIASSEDSIRAAVQEFQPELIICPMLKQKIPQDVYKKIKCLIVHPGIKGDRGPSSLDHAILNNEMEWGVTVIEAADELDAGDIWATGTFKMKPNMSKTHIYNQDVTMLAQKLVLECVNTKYDRKTPYQAESLDYNNPSVKGRLQPTIKASDTVRCIDWKIDSTETVMRKILAADTSPGARAELIVGDQAIVRHIYGPTLEMNLNKERLYRPGQIFAKKHEAVCVAAADGGAVWLAQLKNPKTKGLPSNQSFKLPATLQLNSLANDLPDVSNDEKASFTEIALTKEGPVGIVNFDFYNGAMSTSQCDRLVEAIRSFGADKSTRVLVFAGSNRNWSNGIHLNVIEAAADAKQEAWNNIRAINRVVKEIIKLNDMVTVSAMQVNAGAGGFYMALASDFVFAKPGIVFNPHYKNMGLYGSELHTFTATKRISNKQLKALTENPSPLLSSQAIEMGLIDNMDEKMRKFDYSSKTGKNTIVADGSFMGRIRNFAHTFTYSSNLFDKFLNRKKAYHEASGLMQSVLEHETLELNEMKEDIFNDRNAFAEKRHKFVCKL